MPLPPSSRPNKPPAAAPRAKPPLPLYWSSLPFMDCPALRTPPMAELPSTWSRSALGSNMDHLFSKWDMPIDRCAPRQFKSDVLAKLLDVRLERRRQLRMLQRV